MTAGTLILIGGLDVTANAGIVSIPMALIGLGMGALASQLGAVTVSSVDDGVSVEVGGLQNTATNFGASLGTALAGTVLIASLSASFQSGIQHNAAIPADVKTQATVELASGVPFVSDSHLRTALQQSTLTPAAQDAVLQSNQEARIVGLRSALAVVALLAVLALFFTGLLPKRSLAAATAAAATDLE